jgi:hypothetical protein
MSEPKNFDTQQRTSPIYRKILPGLGPERIGGKKLLQLSYQECMKLQGSK